MPARYQGLNDDALDHLGSFIRATYLDGQCYEFAIALSEMTAWPMIGLIHNGTIRHAMVERPDGQYFDARGPFNSPEAGIPFGIAHPILRPVDDSEITAVRPVHDSDIALAKRLIVALWPNLPAIPGSSLRQRVMAFAAELEDLSRRHALWIRAPYPASRPVMATGDGDEDGYVVQPTDDGFTYTIDRVFTSQPSQIAKGITS